MIEKSENVDSTIEFAIINYVIPESFIFDVFSKSVRKWLKKKLKTSWRRCACTSVALRAPTSPAYAGVTAPTGPLIAGLRRRNHHKIINISLPRRLRQNLI